MIPGGPASPESEGQSMAQYHDAAPERPVSLAGLTNLAGAALSLALIAGIAVWGYRLILRDVSGVPVVRALEGPMRVAPDDPGGSAAQYQGLAVNAVAAEGAAAAPADRLILAPPPLELSLEDIPRKPLVPDLTDATPSAEAGDPASAVSAEAVLKASLEPPSAEAGADLAAAEAAAMSLENPEVGPSLSEVVAGGLGSSLRPRERPESFADVPEAVARAVASARSATGVIDVDPDSIPEGTRLAQLGAYESPEVARAEWDRLALRLQDFLEAKQRVVQRAESGGRTFYRLRAMGFADLSDARRFCSAMVAEGADCIPVVAR